MLDALNAIVDFFNMIGQLVVNFISGSELLSGFVASATGSIYYLFKFIPVQFMPFAYVTVVLSVIMFVVGRTNNAE